ILDERGDPVAPASGSWTGTNNLPAITGQTPSAISAANVTAVCLNPTTGNYGGCGTLSTTSRAAVVGEQTVQIAFPATGIPQRILPTTITSSAVTLTADNPQPGGCTATPNTSLPLDFQFVPGNASTPDSVLFRARSPVANTAARLVNGCNYTLLVYPCQMAN